MHSNHALTPEVQRMSHALSEWFHAHARPLPWRIDRSPYSVWLSEIMLQQTQVDTVIPYYHRFLEAFPTVHDLAHASQTDVLKLWEGLGYYRRARHLHAAAQIIAHDHHGQFPSDEEALRALPGMGPYTSAAVYAFAFNGRAAAVDGNVFRVLSRLGDRPWRVGDSKAMTQARQELLKLVTPETSAVINEAMIELGATVCTRRPQCAACPIQAHCRAYAKGTQLLRPTPRTRKATPVEPWTFLILLDATSTDELHTYVEQRPADGLLADLWQFPACAGHFDASAIEAVVHAHGLTCISEPQELPSKVHRFSHLAWDLQIFSVAVRPIPGQPSDYVRVTTDQLHQLPFSSALSNYRRYAV